MNDKYERDFQKIESDIRVIPPDVRKEFIKRNTHFRCSVRLDADLAVYNRILSPNDIMLCAKTDLLIISGHAKTDSTGKVNIPIQFCSRGDGYQLVIIDRPNFVATAQGPTPSFITVTTHSTITQKPDYMILLDQSESSIGFERNILDNVSVDVMTWRGNESSAGDIEFSWICTIEVAGLVYMG